MRKRCRKSLNGAQWSLIHEPKRAVADSGDFRCGLRDVDDMTVFSFRFVSQRFALVKTTVRPSGRNARLEIRLSHPFALQIQMIVWGCNTDFEENFCGAGLR
jgi:hypothetical protein